MAEQPVKVPVKTSSRLPDIFEETWQPLARLRTDMERMFDDFFSAVSSSLGGRKGAVEPFRAVERMFTGSAPAVDLVEKENAYDLHVELPGMDEKDVQLGIREDVLTISGEKKGETEEERRGYHFSERRFGAFRRSFRLPEDVDQDKIEASFRKGLLTITLPKNPEAAKGEKKIEVKAE
jgi:HSP20 family protein